VTAEFTRITRAVAEHYGVPYEWLVATRAARGRRWRDPYIVEARHVAMVLIRQLCAASYQQIGRYFHMDHTTVLSGIRRVSAATPRRAEPVMDQLLFPGVVVGHA
jgi:chromosomal replication initiation ATPase DnaA